MQPHFSTDRPLEKSSTLSNQMMKVNALWKQNERKPKKVDWYDSVSTSKMVQCNEKPRLLLKKRRIDPRTATKALQSRQFSSCAFKYIAVCFVSMFSDGIIPLFRVNHTSVVITCSAYVFRNVKSFAEHSPICNRVYISKKNYTNDKNVDSKRSNAGAPQLRLLSNDDRCTAIVCMGNAFQNIMLYV